MAKKEKVDKKQPKTSEDKAVEETFEDEEEGEEEKKAIHKGLVIYLFLEKQ